MKNRRRNVERASREGEALGARIAGLQRDLEETEARVAAKQGELDRLTRETVTLRAETEREHAERIAALSLEYGEREKDEKRLHAERLGAMERSYDEAHQAFQAKAEHQIGAADRAIGEAIERRDLSLLELGREESEARDRLDSVRAEIGVAEGQLTRARASLREIFASAQAAEPPEPD